jgi:hypothetical protein
MVISSSVVCVTTALKSFFAGKVLVEIRRSKRSVKLVLTDPAYRISFHGPRMEAIVRDPSTIPLTNTDKQERERH